MAVLGVDAFKGGWVAVRIDGDAVSGDHDGAIAELVARHNDVVTVAVDMPIGVPEKVRPADQLAREFVGVRRNSVFMTPPQAVLDATPHATASRIAVELTGKGISQQAYALRAKIGEVAALASEVPHLVEVHPEVSFRAMSASALAWAKTSWNGMEQRRLLLAKEGIELPTWLGEAGIVPPADVLDAAAAAWSAKRVAAGVARSLPDGAHPGQREVIWY